MPTRIGYFGGSFDPPHRGHLAVACAARDRFALRRVLLAPTGRQPFKPGGAAASFNDRLAMTGLLCAGQKGLEASPLDAPQPGGTPNYTAEALRRLRAELPSSGGAVSDEHVTSEIFMIVGADTFLGVTQWHEGAMLLRENDWVVVSRPGVSPAALRAARDACEPGTRVHLLDDLWDPASATTLRDRLRQGKSAEDMLVPAVAEYIRAHHLYAGS